MNPRVALFSANLILANLGIGLHYNLEVIATFVLLNAFAMIIISNNQNMVNDYKSGNTRASKALMGLVMKEGKGSIDPSLANKMLMECLNKND